MRPGNIEIRQPFHGHLAIPPALVTPDPAAAELLGCDERTAQAAEAVKDDLPRFGEGVDQEPHLLDGLRAGVQLLERPEDAAIHPNEHVVRVLDGFTLPCLHDPRARIKIQAGRPAYRRPDAVPAEPGVKVGHELEALPPGQDAAGPEDSADFL